MLKHKMKIGVVFFLFCMMQNVFAQYATEMFIPMGQSPGISGKYTTLGKIDAVNIQNKTLSMSDASGRYKLQFSDKTKVWLDQSKLKLNNKKASIQDIRKGMRAEVKYLKNEKNGTAEWIKVQHTE